MTTPLNHPNHSLETKSVDIRSYYQNLSPNKSPIIRINTQSIDSTDSLNPILHLNKTKTFIKSLNLENNLSVNGLKDKSSDSIVVYRLSTDKNKELLKRSTPSSQSTHSLDTNPPKKRYLVSQRSGKVYEVIDRNQTNSIPIKREATEPDTDLICDDEYFKYLNLIGSKKLKTESKSSLNQWSLRNISKVVPNPKYDHLGRIILTDVCPKHMPSEADINLNTGEEGSRRKLAKSQWLTEVKDNSNRFVDQRDIVDDMSRKREKELKEWNINALNTISFFGLSSFMGKRIFVSLFCPLNQLQKYYKTIDSERFCSESFVRHLASISLSTSGVTRITRTRDGNDWNPRNYQHKYCFTRMQRLENWRQLETGLNWRSRLLKSQCRRVLVQINRIKKCPICAKTLEFEPRHQCYEFEPHLKSVNTPFRSEVYDSSDEVVIIGDDFLDEEMTTNMKPIDNKCSEVEVIKSNEVIKANDDEDDDIMIVEEVFKTKDNNVIIKSLLMSNILRPSIVSSSQKSVPEWSQPSPVHRDRQKRVSLDMCDSGQDCSQQKDFNFSSHLF